MIRKNFPLILALVAALLGELVQMSNLQASTDASLAASSRAAVALSLNSHGS